MIDVVYKLGSGSKFNNEELRYSLRSLSNFKDLGKIYIVGFRPTWIQNIIHIEALDPFLTNKDCNLINKLILASQDKQITEEFLNFSDDQLLMKSCDHIDFMTPYHDNSLINFLPDQKLNRWKTRLKNTITTLQSKGLPSNCYESHIPTLINKYNYTKTVFQYNYPEGQGMCGNTLYFNTIKAQGKPLPENYATRLETLIQEIPTLESICEGRLHFNYAEASICDNLFLFLHNKFPDRSIYEKD